jgi:hypothetical protein
LPKGALEGVGGHFRIKGGTHWGGREEKAHSKTPKVMYLIGSISDGFGIRLVRKQTMISLETKRFRLKEIGTREVQNQIGSESARFIIR